MSKNISHQYLKNKLKVSPQKSVKVVPKINIEVIRIWDPKYKWSLWKCKARPGENRRVIMFYKNYIPIIIRPQALYSGKNDIKKSKSAGSNE